MGYPKMDSYIMENPIIIKMDDLGVHVWFVSRGCKQTWTVHAFILSTCTCYIFHDMLWVSTCITFQYHTEIS